MEENRYIRRIIGSYFGKHFSLWSRLLFANWLRQTGNRAEKERLLSQLWEQTDAVATEETRQDWLSLRRALPTTESTPAARRRTLSVVMKYAAAVVIASVITYAFTRKTTPAAPLPLQERFVAYGERCELLLPDSSKAWIEAGSLVLYPADFETAKNRTIYLWGEATFSVRKNEALPFIVKTSHLEVQALGTLFTVTSYPEDDYTTTLLEEGSVQVSLKESGHSPLLLKPNEQLVYDHKAQGVKIETVDVSLRKMERNGYQIYEDISFAQLLRSLERRYNVTIQSDSRKYAGRHYNVKFSPHETVADAMDILQQLIGIQYKIEGNQIFIY